MCLGKCHHVETLAVIELREAELGADAGAQRALGVLPSARVPFVLPKLFCRRHELFVGQAPPLVSHTELRRPFVLWRQLFSRQWLETHAALAQALKQEIGPLVDKA